MKTYKAVNVYFNMSDKEQKNLYNKLSKLEFQDKIKSKSKFMRQAVQRAVDKIK